MNKINTLQGCIVPHREYNQCFIIIIHGVYPLSQLPLWLNSKEFSCSAGDAGDLDSLPPSGRSPRGGNGNPLHYSCLGNPMERGVWQATVHGVTRVGHDWAVHACFKHCESLHTCNIQYYTSTISLVAQFVKNLPAVQETQVQFLGWEDPLEKEMAIHSSIVAWRIPWTEEPGGLQSMGFARVGHDLLAKLLLLLYFNLKMNKINLRATWILSLIEYFLIYLRYNSSSYIFLLFNSNNTQICADKRENSLSPPRPDVFTVSFHVPSRFSRLLCARPCTWRWDQRCVRKVKISKSLALRSSLGPAKAGRGLDAVMTWP